MSLPAYPAYKPSGVEWLGEIPEGWDMVPSKIAYEIQLGKMLQPKSETSLDKEMSYLKAQHVRWYGVLIDDLPQMWASSFDEEKYAVQNGDLLVCEGGEVGRAAILKGLEEPCIIQNALHRVRSTDLGDTRYFSYVLRHIADADWFDIICNKATIAHLTGEKLGALKSPRPPLPEQSIIADYLDQKTGQIDELIGKKKELIERLKEQRTAIITHAVTKGLDDSAPMKDSGVEWLGQVPEHWDVRRLKFVIEKVQTGTTPPSAKEIYYDEPDTLWFTPVDFGSNGLVLYDSKKSLNHLALEDGVVKLIPAGSIMIVGIGATLGKVAQAGNSGTSNQQINAVIPSDCIEPLYLLYFLSVMQEPMKVISNATTLGIMNQDKTKQIPTPLPAPDEQQVIIDYLDKKTGQIDGLIGKAEEVIQRLEEYRTAVITAAVTGKVKVR